METIVKLDNELYELLLFQLYPFPFSDHEDSSAIYVSISRNKTTLTDIEILASVIRFILTDNKWLTPNLKGKLKKKFLLFTNNRNLRTFPFISDLNIDKIIETSGKESAIAIPVCEELADEEIEAVMASVLSAVEKFLSFNQNLDILIRTYVDDL